MTRSLVRACLCVCVLGLLSTAAWAQYPSELVGFNGSGPGTIDDPNHGQKEMFRIPEYSTPECFGYIIRNNPPPPNNNNYASRWSNLVTEGAAAMEVSWKWLDPNNPDGWVRLSTFNGAERPNPALDLGGKVRFKITNQSEIFYGQLGICLGIRETGVNVPQLQDGGSLGAVEWVGVDASTLTLIKAGDDGVIDSTLGGDDVIVDVEDDPNITALVISWGDNRTFESTHDPNSDDVAVNGAYATTAGVITPIPAYTLPVTFPGSVALEWDLSNGKYRVDGGAWMDGGFAPFTGDGILGATDSRGTLEHIAFTHVVEAGAIGTIIVGIDELQFEATMPDPVVKPKIVAPIIADDPNVTVTGLITTVDQVELWRDGVLQQNVAVTDPNDVTFVLSAGADPNLAMGGEVFEARQHDSVSGLWSDFSNPVTVLPEPSPFTLSFVLDEDGNNCGFDPPGGWEFIGVSDVASLAGGKLYPTGVTLFNDNSRWQTVEFPLDDPNVVIGWLGGNGQVDAAPAGVRSIDSIWFAIADGGWTGPHEAYLDRIELLDPNGAVIDVIQDMEDDTNWLSQVRGQSTTSASFSGLSTTTAYDGTTSHRLLWTYPSSEQESLGLYHNIGFSCGTSPTFSDAGTAIRFHLHLRSEADPNLPAAPEIVGPIVVGDQTTVRVINDPNAVAVQLYVDGEPYGAPVDPNTAETDFVFDPNDPLAVGQSISATQTIGADTSDFAYPKVAQAMPVPPVVDAPIAPGSTSVAVSGLYDAPFASASLVEVFVNGDPNVAGSTTTITGSTASVPLDTITLATGDTVTARQTVNAEVSGLSDAVTVAFVAPVLYKAPAAGETTVRVLALPPDADTVTVTVNTTDFTESVVGDPDRWDVTVSGMDPNETVTAYYTVGGVDSVPSDYETVTTGTATVIYCDDFEYNQTAYEAAWLDSGSAARLTLSTDLNATDPSGTQSIYGAVGTTRVERDMAVTTPTEVNPVIWNVHIFDGYGPGASNVQFAQLNGQVADFFYQHVGMLSWSPQDTNYYQYRANSNGGPNWIDLTEHDAPLRSVGWHTFTIVHKGQRVDVYVDELLAAKNIQLTADTFYDKMRIGGGYSSANDAYYDDYCVEIGPVRFEQIGPQPPLKPAISAPLAAGDTSVLVTGVEVDVTSLVIKDPNATTIGTYAGAMDPNGIVVSLTRSLVALEAITAEATNAIGTTASDPLEVGVGNGAVLISLGVRETGDTGPLGSEGSGTGDLEWVGAPTSVNGAPQGIAVVPGPNWQTIIFDPTDPNNVTGFTGDGNIDGTRGTIDHLAVAVNAASPDRSAGAYTLYVDNVINVEADGGLDFVICDFDDVAFDPNEEILFQEPTFSGSTDQHFAALGPYLSSSSLATDTGNPGQSGLLEWYWLDTTDQRWARIVTSSVDEVPSPIIDLTRSIKIDILLLESAVPCLGDLDCDGEIGFGDINPFVDYLVNNAQWQLDYPACDPKNGDINDDGDYPSFGDINPFVDLLTGGGVPIPCP